MSAPLRVAITPAFLVLAIAALALPASAQQVPQPTYDARDRPLVLSAGSTLRHGEGLADRIEYTIWQTRVLRGAGTCSSQACPVLFNGEVLYARRSRVAIPDSGTAQRAQAPSAAAAAAAVASVRAAAATTAVQIKRAVKIGDKGAEVRRLQDALRRTGRKVSSDGHYGRSTIAAVRDFQRRFKLKADGVAGPATLRALGV